MVTINSQKYLRKSNVLAFLSINGDCVYRISRKVDIQYSHLSKILNILKREGFIISRRKGSGLIYSHTDKGNIIKEDLLGIVKTLEGLK